MSRCFTDPARAEVNFQILDHLKDTKIWGKISSLLDPNTSSPQAHSLQVRHHTKIKVIMRMMLTILGEKHQLFLSSLSLKCSYLLFGKEHIKEILLKADIQKSAGSTELILSCMTILVERLSAEETSPKWERLCSRSSSLKKKEEAVYGGVPDGRGIPTEVSLKEENVIYGGVESQEREAL
ncbi:hypothetical protein Fot_10739 [Forsythia ovata]|uniref:Uncharacterized protein n=1 Tax=Forsythia ovata TaxID=205694 RepID=A0ABD1WHP6_9LAMI